MTTKKIIDGLYFTVGMMLFNPATGEAKTPDELNEDDRYTYDTCMGAIELLKAQKPRAMTLAEVEVSINPVWIEGGTAGGTWAMMPKTLERSIEFVGNGVFTLYPAFAIDEYNKTWRCWTSRPDEKTREETPWE